MNKKRMTPALLEVLENDPDNWYQWAALRDILVEESSAWKDFTGMEISWRLGYLERTGKLLKKADSKAKQGYSGYATLYKFATEEDKNGVAGYTK